MKEFAGKVALVTGGTRGIGRACAEMFAREGAKVALCSRHGDEAATVASQIAQTTGAEVRGFQADVSDPDSVDTLVKAVRETLGSVNILVNNAGIVRPGLSMRMKNEEWAAVLDTNLSGAFYCCRAVSRDMYAARHGRIINMSSVIGLRGQPGLANYAAAKAGLIGFTKGLAKEAASRNVTVNAVAPGYIDTDMTAQMPSDLRASLVERIPLRRTGTCDEVVAAVRFLAGDDASYVTGAVLQVDGGLGM